MKDNLKVIVIGGLLIWLLIFLFDMIFGVSWPSYTMHRIFIWSPTVLIGVYWLIFGGAAKKP